MGKISTNELVQLDIREFPGLAEQIQRDLKNVMNTGEVLKAATFSIFLESEYQIKAVVRTGDPMWKIYIRDCDYVWFKLKWT